MLLFNENLTYNAMCFDAYEPRKTTNKKPRHQQAMTRLRISQNKTGITLSEFYIFIQISLYALFRRFLKFLILKFEC